MSILAFMCDFHSEKVPVLLIPIQTGSAPTGFCLYVPISWSNSYYNYIGHHLKWFPVDSNQWRCHSNAFVKERSANYFF